MRTLLRDILVTLVVALIIFFLLRATIQTSVVITGSMEPTLQIGQRLLINKVSYKFHEPEAGDIVTFNLPDNPKATLIKRIIGLPGDTVEVKMGAVYVNGSPLDEPYIKDPPTYIFHEYEIPENNYFVLGDNRNNSGDSHTGWTMPRQSIIGKAWITIWPPGRWGLVANPLQEQLASATSE